VNVRHVNRVTDQPRRTATPDGRTAYRNASVARAARDRSRYDNETRRDITDNMRRA
jgi:hypothetical protein